MKIFRTQRYRCISADTGAVLQYLCDAGVTVFDVSQPDELTLIFAVQYRSYKRVEDSLGRLDIKWKKLQDGTIPRLLHGAYNHPVLLLGCIVILILTLWIPTRIFFVTVQGNENLSSRQILECTQSCGLEFGAASANIRSEQIKNQLLLQLQQLEWVGVNVNGCVANIRVAEKETEPEPEISRPGSIAAAYDGVIVSIVAQAGEPLCKVGDQVNAGQILISGYTDCEKVLMLTGAKGEVMARTKQNLRIMSPYNYIGRGPIRDKEVKYSLRIGKKLIKFYNDSGISPAGCVKMNEEYDLCLPGNMLLPVTLIQETRIYYDLPADGTVFSPDHQQLLNMGKLYLLSRSVAATIHDARYTVSQMEDVCVLDCRFDCTQMIGTAQYEDILQ